MMTTIVIANQKGGVGKSAISSHLAFYCAELRLRVLLIDLDAQRNATDNICETAAVDAEVSSNIFFGDKLNSPQIVALPNGKRISVIGGDKRLLEVDATPRLKEGALREYLSKLPDYDVCIIDLSPSFGKRFRAALLAGDYVVMPFEPAHESVNGLADLVESIDAARKENPRLAYVGFLANKVNSRSAGQAQTLDEVKKMAGSLLMPERVMNRTAITEMLKIKKPVWRTGGGASQREAGKEMLAACAAIIKRTKIKVPL